MVLNVFLPRGSWINLKDRVLQKWLNSANDTRHINRLLWIVGRDNANPEKYNYAEVIDITAGWPLTNIGYFLSQHRSLIIWPVNFEMKLPTPPRTTAAPVNFLKWLCNFITNFKMDVITCPWWVWNQSMLVEGAPGLNLSTRNRFDGASLVNTG